jgi:hypothetical protein
MYAHSHVLAWSQLSASNSFTETLVCKPFHAVSCHHRYPARSVLSVMIWTHTLGLVFTSLIVANRFHICCFKISSLYCRSRRRLLRIFMRMLTAQMSFLQQFLCILMVRRFCGSCLLMLGSPELSKAALTSTFIGISSTYMFLDVLSRSICAPLVTDVSLPRRSPPTSERHQPTQKPIFYTALVGRQGQEPMFYWNNPLPCRTYMSPRCLLSL